MTTFRVELINEALEVNKYMVTAKNALFAECKARASYGQYESSPIKAVKVTPLSQESPQATKDKYRKRGFTW